MQLSAIVSTVTALAVLAAACGGDAAAPTSTAAATTTTTTSTTEVVATTTTPGTSTTTTTAATTTTEAPAITLDELPPLIGAGPDGITLGVIGGRQLVAPVPSDEPGEWVDAAGDGAGGFVYVAAGDSGQIIWWWPAGATEPRVVSFKPGRVFHEAAVIDGRPTIIVVDDPNPALGAEPREFVQLIDLEDGGTEEIRQVGGIVWGAAQVSYRAGTFLVTEFNHSCGDLVAFDRAGTTVRLPLHPVPACQIHFEVPYAGGVLSPDGSWAYLERHTVASGEPGGTVTHTDLVVVRDGTEAVRVEVAGEGVNPGALRFDGRWALIQPGWTVVQVPEEDPQPFIVVDTSGPIRVATVDAVGFTSLRFLETPLATG